MQVTKKKREGLSLPAFSLNQKVELDGIEPSFLQLTLDRVSSISLPV